MINITNSMAANKKKRNLLKWVCFLAYLLFLSYIVFYNRIERNEYRYNLVLFQEIGRYYYLGMNTGNWRLFIFNVIGNIVVFMPVGMFLPSLFSRCRNILFTTILGFEISLCVELVQLITRVGSFDVDDLLLNTLGGVCGIILYSIYRGIKHLFSNR